MGNWFGVCDGPLPTAVGVMRSDSDAGSSASSSGEGNRDSASDSAVDSDGDALAALRASASAMGGGVARLSSTDCSVLEPQSG